MFEKNVSKRERILMQAQRMATIELNNRKDVMDRLWWNKLQTLSHDDLEMLPLGFSIKYGTFVTKVNEAQLFTGREMGEYSDNRKEVVKYLDRL